VARGTLAATSEDAATELLGQSGFQVLSMRQVTRSFSLEKLMARYSRTRPAEIILFYRQLALLLGSGIDIITALELLQQQTTSQALVMALGEVISELRGGSRLSVALRKHPRFFSDTSCRLLHIGEETGSFESTLQHLAEHMEKEQAAAKGIKGALAYPILAAVITMVVVAVLLMFVFPAFGDLYGSLGAELPAMTSAMIEAGNLFRKFGGHLFLVLVAVVLSGVAYVRTPKGRYRWDRLLLSLPIIGRVSHLKELARICRSISLLFHAGMPVTEVIRLTARASGNKVVAEALDRAEKDMLKGEGLSRPMAKNPIFLPLMVQMVRIGEETGNLDTNLQAVAQNYEVEAEDKLKAAIGMIQPAMTLVIGLMIAVIALSLTTAMYSIYGQGI